MKKRDLSPQDEAIWWLSLSLNPKLAEVLFEQRQARSSRSDTEGRIKAAAAALAMYPDSRSHAYARYRIECRRLKVAPGSAPTRRRAFDAAKNKTERLRQTFLEFLQAIDRDRIREPFDASSLGESDR